jgi:hypothetical protein
VSKLWAGWAKGELGDSLGLCLHNVSLCIHCVCAMCVSIVCILETVMYGMLAPCIYASDPAFTPVV